jgi:hypothetical protein
VKITQTDSRSVRIETPDGGFGISYRIYWNGFDREPESIVLEGSEVRAFFLFATVRDVISEDGMGIRIARNWQIMAPGLLRLSMEATFGAEGRLGLLFPGAHLLSERPTRACALLGEKTTLPSSLFLFPEEGGVLLFSDFPGNEAHAVSIGIGVESADARRQAPGQGHRLSVEVRLPPADGATDRAGVKRPPAEEQAEAGIASSGPLDMSRALNVVFGQRGDIMLKGIRSALDRLVPSVGPPADWVYEASIWSRAVLSCLDTHLFERGGVMGLREQPGSPYLSASAGAAFAFLLLRLLPADADRLETALRLADFCLKGQHPTGLFFESYSVEKGEWRGARGKEIQASASRRLRRGTRGPRPPHIPFAASARIAEMLFRISETLAEMGVPGEKYARSAERFVEFFLDAKGRLVRPGSLHVPGDPIPAETGLPGFSLFFPLFKLFERAGKDRYRKALIELARDFSSIPWDASLPPSSREGRDPDSEAALMCGRLAAEMTQAGFGAQDPEVFMSFLAQWINVNRPPRAIAVDPLGGLADSFYRKRFLCAGAEAAYVLASLSALSRRGDSRETARRLALLALGFDSRAPLGTAHFDPGRGEAVGAGGGGAAVGAGGGGKTPGGRAAGELGPVDSRRLAREAYFAWELKERFPAFLDGKRKAVKARRVTKTSSRSGSSSPSRRPSAKS